MSKECYVLKSWQQTGDSVADHIWSIKGYSEINIDFDSCLFESSAGE